MGGTSQPWMAQPQQPTPDQIAALTPPPPPAAPATSGYNSDLANPAAMPIGSSVAPGSTSDLEQRAAQGPQALGRQLQQQQPSQQSGYDPQNPFLPIIQDYQNRAQQTAPQEPRSGIKGLLTNFFSGMGNSMMQEAGLTPPNVRHDQIMQHLATMTQFAGQWEQMQGLEKYRSALTDKMTQDAAFEAQMQPLRLQEAQQAVQRGQEAAQTIHPAMSAADLKSLGVPDDLAQQYSGHQLTSADIAALKDLSAAGQTKIFDYGQDGTGQGKGQWLVSGKDYTPIKQLSPISEAGRATALQRQQFAQQNALQKASGQLVVAYDPLYQNPNGTRGGNVVMSQADAQQKGLQHYKADPSNLNATIAGFNDVQQKINMLADVANNPSRMGQVDPQLAAQLLHHGHGITFGAFGTTLDMSQLNERLYATELSRANQATKDYVTAMGAAHEALTQLPRLQTFGKSSRVTEKQMEAAQNMLPQPGDAGDPSMAQQKMMALQTTIDPLRKQLPHMQGAELLPTWTEQRQTSVRQSTGTSGGFNWNSFPVHQTQ